MSITCPACGEENRDGARICELCRTLFGSVATVASHAKVPAEAISPLLGMDFITTFKVKIDSAQQVLILTLPQSDAKTPAGHGEQWWRRLFRQFKEQRKHWELYRDAVDQRMAKSQISEGAGMERLKRLRVLADNQAQEAEKLHNRLERHASNHSVPREWR